MRIRTFCPSKLSSSNLDLTHFGWQDLEKMLEKTQRDRRDRAGLAPGKGRINQLRVLMELHKHVRPSFLSMQLTDPVGDWYRESDETGQD